MKIGIKNFRIFDKETNFEIRPLTILVGPNNSGKSSFTKFLMLLKNGYDYLEFNINDDHNLSSYDKELNRDSGSDELKLNFSITDEKLLSKQVDGSITYIRGGKIKNGFFYNSLISIESAELDNDNRYGIYTLTIKTQEFIDFIKNNLMGVLELKNKTSKFDLFDYGLIKTMRKNINLDIKYEFDIDPEFLRYKKLVLLSELYHELNIIGPPYLFYEVYINGVLDLKNQNIDNIQTENIVSYFEFAFDQWKLDSELFYQHFNTDSIAKKIRESLEKKFQGIIERNSIEIKPSKLYHLLFDKTFSKSNYDYSVTLISFSELFFRKVFIDLKIISDNIYMPAKRGVPERYFKTSDFAFEIISKYNKNKIRKKNFLEDEFTGENIKKFRNSLTKIFDIDGEIIIKEFENLQAVYIRKGDKEENLADLGIGFNQLIPLILFFHNMSYINNSFKTIIIEEPEANLHPALQSKLADFFALVLKTYHGIHLIIETHSEYLIRKLQYLVAKREMPLNDCVIHYFNSTKNSINDDKVKTIEILENGMLSDQFGTGFFDEVSFLQVELMNLIKQRLN